MDRVAIIRAGLDASNLLGVEIGALDKPIVKRSDGKIIYVDYADRDFLMQKYRNDSFVDIDNIVDVDAIWGGNTLCDAVRNQKVDYVIASHVIEHVPDLITWLAELRSILKDSGEIRLAVPDRRFTFDYLRGETRLSDVLAAYLVKARHPQPHEVLDYLLGATPVDCGQAWEEQLDLAHLKCPRPINEALYVARDTLENGTYHDCHCWVFTPKSFAKLFATLAQADLIDFACERFYDTHYHTIEFFVTLRPSADKAYVVRSWEQMAADAQALPANSRTGKATTLVQQQQDMIDQHLRVIEEQKQAIHHATEQLGSMRDELSKAHQTARLGEHAQIRVAELEHSSSWRITAPLRSAATIVRRWSRKSIP